MKKSKVIFSFLSLVFFVSCGLESKKQPSVGSETFFSHACGADDMHDPIKKGMVPILDLDTIPPGEYRLVSQDMALEWQFGSNTYRYRYLVELNRNSLMKREICKNSYENGDTVRAEFPVVFVYNYFSTNGSVRREYSMLANSIWLYRSKINYQMGGTSPLGTGNFSPALTAEYSRWLVYKVGDRKYEIRGEASGSFEGRSLKRTVVQIMELQN